MTQFLCTSLENNIWHRITTQLVCYSSHIRNVFEHPLVYSVGLYCRRTNQYVLTARNKITKFSGDAMEVNLRVPSVWQLNCPCAYLDISGVRLDCWYWGHFYDLDKFTRTFCYPLLAPTMLLTYTSELWDNSFGRQELFKHINNRMASVYFIWMFSLRFDVCTNLVLSFPSSGQCSWIEILGTIGPHFSLLKLLAGNVDIPASPSLARNANPATFCCLKCGSWKLVSSHS